MSLDNAFDIAAEGLSVTTSQIQTNAMNVANSQTPYYVRKIPVVAQANGVSFQGVLEDMQSGVFQTGMTMGGGGVVYEGNMEDPTPGKKMYMPGHPQADKDGFVTLSNVNVVADIADATRASRLYEANLAVIGVVKQLGNRAMDIGRAQ